MIINHVLIVMAALMFFVWMMWIVPPILHRRYAKSKAAATLLMAKIIQEGMDKKPDGMQEYQSTSSDQLMEWNVMLRARDDLECDPSREVIDSIIKLCVSEFEDRLKDEVSRGMHVVGFGPVNMKADG